MVSQPAEVAIAELITTVKQAIQNIYDSQQLIPDLAAINSNVRSALREVETKLQNIEIHGEECEDDAQKKSLLDWVSHQRQVVKQLNANLRSANEKYQLESKNLILESRKSLMGTDIFNQKTSTFKKATKVTSLLEDTRNNLEENLSRTTNAMSVLGNSSQVLRASIAKQSQTSVDIQKATDEIKRLDWQEKKDRFMTRAAALLFILLCIWIFNKRIPIVTYTYKSTRFIYNTLAPHTNVTKELPSTQPTTQIPQGQPQTTIDELTLKAKDSEHFKDYIAPPIDNDKNNNKDEL
ncbi:vesicle transport protein SEC20 [Acrasis kona]|uniref:Vesicle transport protein SEC20 n=1 Tax=Acrasis kona TaxID=1008807 RepID=A0AAW2YMN9_9EUKA